MLSCLQPLNLNIGLYKDDALGVPRMTPRQADICKKEVCKIFQKHNLSITIEVNLKVVNFLDITLDLNSGVFKPYMKPDNLPQYINRRSNHPPAIIKSIPEAVNKRLSSRSQNEQIFNAAKAPFQEALAKSGFEHELKYQKPSSNQRNKNRSRNQTWFNPPFSQNVSTNVGAKFLKLIDSCFPPYHPLAKIMNRNTIKVGYRCMANMGQVINRHNAKIVESPVKETTPPCNCKQGPQTCPVEGACQTKGVIYEATVTTNTGKKETYTGLTSRRFKDRYYEHTSDINNEKNEGTSLSNYIWTLKNENTPYRITWKIITRAQSFNPSTKRCNLCIREKFCIMFRAEGASLNSRSEFFSTCRHRLKPLLQNVE